MTEMERWASAYRRLDEMTEFILGKFTEYGSLGGVNDSLRSSWIARQQVGRWRDELAECRRVTQDGER